MSQRLPLTPRAELSGLRAYRTGIDVPCAIDLSDNTNLWGMPPAAASALRTTGTERLTRYPSRYGDGLRAVVAASLGITPEMVVTGTGSDGVLDAAVRAFGQPGGTMALPDPTFVMAAPFAVMNGLTPALVPLRPDYDIDVDALLATKAQLIYLCSPNNPTGRAIPAQTLRRVLAGAPGLVIVDEAYAEFADTDALQLVAESDRLLITRTLSKAYGLAGLRVGYGIAPAPVAQAIATARPPYAVSVSAEAAAVAALTEGQAWVRERVADAVAARARLHDALVQLGLQPVRSDANFVFVPLRGAPAVARALSSRGIAVRAFAGLREVSPALEASAGDALRITVGPWALLEPALEALRDVLQQEVAA